MLKTFSSAAIFTAVFAGAGFAQSINASDPWSVMRAVQDYGHEASLSSDSYGDPKVSGTVDGIHYTILFYRCSENTNCEDLQLRASFDLEGVSESAMNRWNLDEAIGKAYINENGSAIVEHYVIDVSDFSNARFDNVLGSFERSMTKFQTHIGW